MSGVNKVILIGNLGSDPEVKHMENGSVVANVSIATSRSYKNKAGEKVDDTEWHRVVFWGKLAEIVESYLRKGKTVYVEGRLTTRKWNDKDGVERYTTEIVAEQMNMLGNNSNTSEDRIPVSDEQTDDLPF